MSYPNPHYDPEWQVARDLHFAEARRLAAEMQHLAAGGAHDQEAYKAAQAGLRRHQKAGEEAYKRQHETVQGYAAWLFGTFPVDLCTGGASMLLPEVDFEALRTVEEADAAWSRLHRIVTEAAGEERSRLPVGQPEEVEAFSDPSAPGLIRAWRAFSPQDLYLSGYAPERGVRTLVTVDERDDGWHVCFMQDWGTPGPSVTNNIEHLATAVYREACAIAEQRASSAGGTRGWVGRVRSRLSWSKPDPARFHVYEHMPPQGDGMLRESFSRVVLRFGGGQYRQPEWRHYRVIPALIQSARYDCAREAVLSSRQALLSGQT